MKKGKGADKILPSRNKKSQSLGSNKKLRSLFWERQGSFKMEAQICSSIERKMVNLLICLVGTMNGKVTDNMQGCTILLESGIRLQLFTLFFLVTRKVSLFFSFPYFGVFLLKYIACVIIWINLTQFVLCIIFHRFFNSTSDNTKHKDA